MKGKNAMHVLFIYRMAFTTYQANSKGGMALLALQANSKGGLHLLGCQADSKGGMTLTLLRRLIGRGYAIYIVYAECSVDGLHCNWQ